MTHIQIYINICCHVLVAAICITMNELCTNTKIFLHTAGLQYFLFSKITKLQKSHICGLDSVRLTQLKFTCSKSRIETLVKGEKYVQN